MIRGFRTIYPFILPQKHVKRIRGFRTIYFLMLPKNMLKGLRFVCLGRRSRWVNYYQTLKCIGIEIFKEMTRNGV